MNPDLIETYDWRPTTNSIVRRLKTRRGGTVETSIRVAAQPLTDLGAAFDRAWLQLRSTPEPAGGSQVRIADLFAGCGAMSIGAVEACRALGKTGSSVFAADTNLAALTVYKKNLRPKQTSSVPIDLTLDSPLGARLSASERVLKQSIGKVDLAIGGPPCQGHSDLNNHTRRRDPKNALYLRMARFVEVFSPSSLIIENVLGVLHDDGDVVRVAEEALQRLGYTVEVIVLNAVRFGVPQRRRRVFLLASERNLPPFEDDLLAFQQPERSFAWACSDLLRTNCDSTLDAPSKPSPTSIQRIDYLFDNDLYNLPNSERPTCHRKKKHTYTSVYGRLRWNDPAQTITTGFGSMGQGRFVHPKLRRTITPHEAARLQFIPDFFSFGDAGRSAMADMIGNAVPTKLSYLAALHLLR